MNENLKILLLSPEVPNTFWSLKGALKFISKSALLPPLGLLTVAAMLPESFEKKLVDLNVTPLRDRDIVWADYVFISAMVVQKRSVDQIIERCRKLNVKTVAGGPLFTAFPESYSSVDHLVLNEAEVTLPLFLNDLENGSPEKLYLSRQKPDLTGSPVPNWDLINMKDYALMPVQFSRGCPFNCEFCDISYQLGTKVRTKTINQVISELQNLYNSNWRGDVFFVDDNFIGKRHILKTQLLPAITRWMDEHNRPFLFNTQASIDMADDDELMKLMAKAGFECVFVGIESPEDSSLAECNKTQNKGRDIVADIKKIQQFGIQVQAGFIIGFDSDNPSVFNKMITLIQDCGIVTAMVGLLNAPRGTKLYKKLKQEHRLTKPPTGDNMDCTMNFTPKMEINTLLKGYQQVLDTIYSQKYYCRRIKTFLENYNFSNKTKRRIRFTEIKAFILSMWQIGLIEKGKLHYWLLILWAMKKPNRLVMAVRLSICGFHFRQILKNIHPQILTTPPKP